MVERRRPRHPHPEAGQGRVRKAGVIPRYLSYFPARRSRTVAPPALVRVGVARLDCDKLPPPPTGTAHRFPHLRYRRRVDSLAAVSTHCDRNVA